MRLLFRIFLLLLFTLPVYAQIEGIPEDTRAIGDSLKEFGTREPANDSLKIHTPVINDYTYWRQRDFKSEIIDTVLNIESYFSQNPIQRDAFGKMPFPNIGQTYNPLMYTERPFRLHLLPEGKSFNYILPEDVRYYDVKTPMTEFIYESGVKEGQYLSTTFAHNLTPQWNYSVRYRGLRSLGSYRHSLSSVNSFIATISHHSKNDKLRIWTHYASQIFNNEENGGIKNLDQFENDSEHRTQNRQNIAVNLNNADTRYDARRFHLGASYRLFGKVESDSLSMSAPLLLKNVFTYEKQKFYYEEPGGEDYYDIPLIPDLGKENLKSLETLQNTSSIEFRWGEKLLMEAGLRYEKLRMYAPDALAAGLINIPEAVEDDLLGGIARLNFDWNDRVTLTADAEFKSGKIFKEQYHVNANLTVQPIEGYKISGGVLLESAFPSLNLFYNQSFYKDFNYYNFSFKNVNTQKLYGKLEVDRLNTSVEASVYNIENYVYVNPEFRPKQLGSGVTMFQIRADNLFTYRKFNLRTTIQYQKVTQNADFLPLPDLIGRVALYWQDYVFNNKAELQVGINANYFTKFESREFFPVINEFMIQRTHPDFGIQKIGGFPLLDFFVNFKIDRMRIYLRLDHINSMFGENNYYSAPFVPYRDFKIQIGLKWYLFT